MKTILKTLAALLTLTVLATACGDDGDGGGSATPASADSPLVQAIVDDVLEDGDGVTTDRDEAECFVGGVVDEIGEDRIRALGVSEENVAGLDEIDWTTEEAESVVDKLFSCMDLTENFIDQMEFGDLDEGQTDCVRGVFTEDVLKEFFVASFTGDESGMAGIFELMGELTECGVNLFGE